MGDLQFNGPPLDQGGDLKGILTRQGPVPLASLHFFMFLKMFLRFLMIGAEMIMLAGVFTA